MIDHTPYGSNPIQEFPGASERLIQLIERTREAGYVWPEIEDEYRIELERYYAGTKQAKPKGILDITKEVAGEFRG